MNPSLADLSFFGLLSLLVSLSLSTHARTRTHAHMHTLEWSERLSSSNPSNYHIPSIIVSGAGTIPVQVLEELISELFDTLLDHRAASFVEKLRAIADDSDTVCGAPTITRAEFIKLVRCVVAPRVVAPPRSSPHPTPATVVVSCVGKGATRLHRPVRAAVSKGVVQCSAARSCPCDVDVASRVARWCVCRAARSGPIRWTWWHS
jgi:hypothetical protein